MRVNPCARGVKVPPLSASHLLTKLRVPGRVPGSSPDSTVQPLCTGHFLDFEKKESINKWYLYIMSPCLYKHVIISEEEITTLKLVYFLGTDKFLPDAIENSTYK